jgi:hypothetical protein
MTDPVNADFTANLDCVNVLAERAPGFVWRLVGEGDNAMDIQAFDNPNTAINMSVWRDLDALANFVYRSEAHREIMSCPSIRLCACSVFLRAEHADGL